ncbi:MAG: hypothetical protein AAF493_04670, partial [Pseudomonadota bacterium]
MSLSHMIASHDESVLETMSSKGLLRRSRRDVSNAEGEVEFIDERRAVIRIAGQTVELVDKGPLASMCTCQAHGVCRHIISAILLLRERPDDAHPDDAHPDDASAVAERAVEQLCALTHEQLVKFAGADWDKAIELVSEEITVTFGDEGLNLTARMAELNATITFINGKALRAAA